MPLDITITAATFVRETTRGGLMSYIGWDTALMDAVVTALGAHERQPTPANRSTLSGAIWSWKTGAPNEFDNRDRLSGGVVRKLAVQCGLDDYRPPPAPAVRFLGAARVNPTQRRVPQVQPLSDPAAKVMQDNAHDSALLVVDLYGDDLHAQGLTKRFGSTNSTVAQHIQDLLAASSFKTDTGRTVTIPVFVCCKNTTPQGAELLGTFKNSIGNPVPQPPVVSKTNSVLAGTTLLVDLQNAGVRTVFVTGFDANMCVAVTIFGSGATGPAYVPGLLDHGFDVVTSRFIVASGDMPLRSQDGWPYMGPCNK